MRIIIYKFGAFPNQVAKLVHIAHRWILAVPADDKKKAEDNNYKFSLIHFTDVPGYEDKVPDIIYNTLCDIYQNDIKQTEV